MNPLVESGIDGSTESSDVRVLWTFWEWRCEWTIDGSLRLFHNAERYADEVVHDAGAAQGLAKLWLAAVKNLTVPAEEPSADENAGRGGTGGATVTEDAKPAPAKSSESPEPYTSD